MTAAEREELETLREENRQLRALLMPGRTRWPLGLSDSEGFLIDCVVSGKLSTNAGLAELLTFRRNKEVSESGVRVAMFTARKKLKARGFTLLNQFGQGYYFPDDQLEALRKVGFK